MECAGRVLIGRAITLENHNTVAYDLHAVAALEFIQQADALAQRLALGGKGLAVTLLIVGVDGNPLHGMDAAMNQFNQRNQEP